MIRHNAKIYIKKKKKKKMLGCEMYKIYIVLLQYNLEKTEGGI